MQPTISVMNVINFFNEGLRHSATSSECTKAIATMMAYDWDEHDLARFIINIFDIKARIPRVRV
jgi:hypothetical protein